MGSLDHILSWGGLLAFGGGSWRSPLIESPPDLFAFLVAMLAAVFWLAGRPSLTPLFRFFPPLIWSYFVPMLLAWAGIIPGQSRLYSEVFTGILLPAVVVLLLVPTDATAIARVGRKAIIIMLIGTAGIVTGAVGSLALYQAILPADTLPPDIWKGMAALSGSWIGGSPNMAAISASLGLSSDLFGKLVIVDTVCAYSWLAVLIGLSRYQHRVDRRLRADSSVVDELAVRLEREEAERARPITLADFVLMLAVGLGVGQLALLAGRRLAEVISTAESMDGLMATINLSRVLTGFGWGIMIATFASLALSFTRLRRIGDAGAYSIGNAGLYLLLTSFGAQADLRGFEPAKDLWLIAIGATWLLIHVIVLVAGLWLLRAPLFLGATASMANIGGTASAPVVAGAFHPSLAPLGVLLAVLGGILGTPIGLLIVARLCAAIVGT